MLRGTTVIAGSLLLGVGLAGAAPLPQNGIPLALQVETSLGNFTLVLYPEKAPRTVENFLSYVDINLEDNAALDAVNFRDKAGYCVFGQVVEGLDVIDRIAGVKTTTRGHLSDVPTEEVVIFSIRRLKR